MRRVKLQEPVKHGLEQRFGDLTFWQGGSNKILGAYISQSKTKVEEGVPMKDALITVLAQECGSDRTRQVLGVRSAALRKENLSTFTTR